jgi:hypothetical protein
MRSLSGRGYMPFSSLNKNKNKNKNGFFFAAVFSKVIQSIHNSGG